jgi:hypothetical protein
MGRSLGGGAHVKGFAQHRRAADRDPDVSLVYYCFGPITIAENDNLHRYFYEDFGCARAGIWKSISDPDQIVLAKLRL